MPGRGHAFQITTEWQDAVRRWADENGHNELARQARMSPSSLTAVLKPGAIQTTKMPAINKVVGLPPPVDKPSPTVLEGARYLQQMSEIEQGRWVEKLKQAAEASRRSRR